jgi:UDP-glucose 4-epimerase
LERIIITGGTGFIGRHLVDRLLTDTSSSIVLISNGPEYMKFTQPQQSMPLAHYTADIRDREAITRIFRNERADFCIHLAAKISVADSIRNPDETMDINVKGTLNVLDACYNSRVNNFVFASSAAVYGDVKELPISENQTLRPLSPYGSSKMHAEELVSSYQKQNKIKNTISLRIFNVYGEGQASEADVITRFARRLSSGQPPAIYGNGMQTRDFISVDDVVDAFLLSIRSMENAENNNHNLPSPFVFNVGTGIPTSINDLAQKMIELFGLDLQPIYEEVREDDRVILHSYADMTKAKEILHFVPKKAIAVGLREIIGSMLLRE